jgi:hypothetical protein
MRHPQVPNRYVIGHCQPVGCIWRRVDYHRFYRDLTRKLRRRAGPPGERW